MKTKLLSIAVIFALVLSFTGLLLNDDAAAESPLPPLVYITLTGNGNTTATVWIKDASGTITYIPHTGGGVYQKQSNVPDGKYDVFACSNYPSYGSSYDHVIDPPDVINTTIALQGGECPFGD